MNFLRELFYLRKSDRQTILALLCVIVIGLCVVFFAPTGPEKPTDSLLTPNKETTNDSIFIPQGETEKGLWLSPQPLRFAVILFWPCAGEPLRRRSERAARCSALQR